MAAIKFCIILFSSIFLSSYQISQALTRKKPTSFFKRNLFFFRRQLFSRFPQSSANSVAERIPITDASLERVTVFIWPIISSIRKNRQGIRAKMDTPRRITRSLSRQSLDCTARLLFYLFLDKREALIVFYILTDGEKQVFSSR